MRLIEHGPRLVTTWLTIACLAAGMGGFDRAFAQMQLPGANNGVAGDKPAPSAAPGGEAPYVPPKPIVIKPPGIDTIVGHALLHDGANGSMTFDLLGTDLVLSKVVFAGAKISKPGQACSVDVALSPPLTATPDGRPVGAARYSVPLEACPFDIDVLDGAALVSNPTPSCDFVAADCRVSPGGLWGPAATEFTPQRIKDLERERVRIETTMRADFRALLKKAGKDKTAVKAIASEQAGFSSDREVACRDYAQESTHGFCSTRITQARVLALIAKFGGDAPADHRHATHARPRLPATDSPPPR